MIHMPHDFDYKSAHSGITYETKVITANEQFRNCVKGQLTIGGIKNCYKMVQNCCINCVQGQLLRDRYLNPANRELYLHGVESDFNHDKVFVRCTEISTRRTEQSAIYTILGMFPGVWELNSTIPKVQITMVEQRIETMYPQPDLCKRLKRLIKDIKKSEDMKQHYEKMGEFSQHMNDVFQLNGKQFRWDKPGLPFFSLLHVLGTLHSIIADRKPLPKGMTPEHVNQINRFATYTKRAIYNNKEVVRLGIGRFVNELLDNMKECASFYSSSKALQVASGKKQPHLLKMYFGHDSTIIPLLSAFDNFGEEAWYVLCILCNSVGPHLVPLSFLNFIKTRTRVTCNCFFANF